MRVSPLKMQSWVWMRINPRSSCSRVVCATNAPLHIHCCNNLILNILFTNQLAKAFHSMLENKSYCYQPNVGPNIFLKNGTSADSVSKSFSTEKIFKLIESFKQWQPANMITLRPKVCDNINRIIILIGLLHTVRNINWDLCNLVTLRSG